MKRARQRDGKKRNIRKEIKRKGFAGYSSDMLELGYDPDSFTETESDIVAEAEDAEETRDLSEVTFSAEELFEEDTSEESDGDEEKETNKQDETVTSEPMEETEGAEKIMRKKKKKPLIFAVSLITVLALFTVVFGLGGFFGGNGETEEEYVVPVEKGTGRVNVLILGTDKNGLRTDTIILACCNFDDNTMKLLSVPRDTRMYIGNRYQKINAAHAISPNGKIKGAQGSIEAVTRLTSIPINYYVEFSFDAFKNTIDALGGVDFDVPQNMNYEDPTQDLYIHLTKGLQHLDGDKAEQLVRFRSYPRGDIARVEMQQSFIQAVVQQKLNTGIIGKIPDLYDVLKKDINTNLTLIDVTKYANSFMDFTPEGITMYSLPGAFGGGEYTTSYWIADMEETKTLIETEFGYDASEATIHSADGTSLSKESADRRATKAPAKTTAPQKTQKPATAAPSATATANGTKATEKPSHTPAAKATATPANTPTATEKATEAPKKTEEPKKTAAPAESETAKPARPTPNTSGE